MEIIVYNLKKARNSNKKLLYLQELVNFANKSKKNMKVVLEYPEISEIITKAIKICEKYNQKFGGHGSDRHTLNFQPHANMVIDANQNELIDISLNRLNQLETAIIYEINNSKTITDDNIENMNNIIKSRIALEDTPININRSINSLINMYKSAIKINTSKEKKTLLNKEFDEFLFNNIDIIDVSDQQKAEELYRYMLKNHPDDLSIMNKLINVLKQQMKLKKAGNLSNIMLRKSLESKNSHYILRSMKTLADIYVAKKELRNARSMYSEALAYAYSIKEPTDDINSLIESIRNSLYYLNHTTKRELFPLISG